MGKELARADSAAAQVFAEADSILGYPLSQACWEGPEAALNDTAVTQPALLTHSVAVLRALATRRPEAVPAAVAGHSLGEFSALVAAGAMEFASALRLVRERGRLMKEAGERAPGGMAAILGLDVEAVDEICRAVSKETGRVVQVANDNCPGQIVISGDEAGLEAALPRLSDAGAKRAVRLAVSIAAHSALMAPVSDEFGSFVDQTEIGDPQIPVIGNVQADHLATTQAARADLKAQLTSRVRWTESIRHLLADGITSFVEVGSGEVLIGLVRRIDRAPSLTALDRPEAIEAFTA
jgi:[acyl-carrier-protein] S-malonyltransferase